MPKHAKVEDVASITGAARLCGIARQTLADAVARGAVSLIRQADGRAVVSLEEVRRWAATPEKMGRPRHD